MTKEAIKSITEKTALPLSIVVSVCSLIALLVLWGSRLEAKVDAHLVTDDARVGKQGDKIQKLETVFRRIDRRLYRLEIKQGIKSELPEGEE